MKIRGVRIELGEIEAALAELEDVREAVVTAWSPEEDDTPGSARRTPDLRLAAYLVPAEGAEELPVPELRRRLAEALPETLVPAAYRWLPELPLSANGKLDRKALPEPELGREALAEDYVAPETDLEKVLVAYWEDLLGLERVGVEDDFFDLGGHSILAMRLLGRLEETFRTELPLRELFRATTVADLAEVITRLEAAPGQAEKIAGIWLKVKGGTGGGENPAP